MKTQLAETLIVLLPWISGGIVSIWAIREFRRDSERIRWGVGSALESAAITAIGAVIFGTSIMTLLGAGETAYPESQISLAIFGAWLGFKYGLEESYKKRNPTNTFTQSEIGELVRLLNKAAARNGWMPDQASFMALHKVVPRAAVELIIQHPLHLGRFLLTVRNDADWHNMMHTPGGYVTMGDDSLIDAVTRIGHKELGEGVNIVSVELLMAYLWTTHPHGRPISLVYACQVAADFELPEGAAWFEEIPHNMIPEQVQFVEAYLAHMHQRMV